MSKLIENVIGFIITIYISLFRVAPDMYELIDMYNSNDPAFTQQIVIRVIAFFFIFMFVTRFLEIINTAFKVMRKVKNDRNNGYNSLHGNNTNNQDHHSTLNGGTNDDNKWDFTK